MRLLVLTSFDIFPPVHGGSSIAYNFVKHASERHEVTVLLSRLYSQGGTPDLPGDNVHVHYCRASVFDRMRVLSFLVNPHYYIAAQRLCTQSQPDVIQCETLWSALAGWYVRRHTGIPWVCVEYNVESEKFAALGRPRPLLALVRLAERFVCSHADALVTVSDQDRELLVKHFAAPPDRTRTIAPSPDLSTFRFDAQKRASERTRLGLASDQPMLTFVGNLKYEPNQEAVRRLAEDIGPAVIAEHPDARFVIIGQGSAAVSEHQRPWITLTGYLSRPELIAHLSATDVFLVPVEMGSGIRIKITEATACGRAVVTTRKAAVGLEQFGDDEIMRVEDAGPGFSAAVVGLIRDRALREALGARGQARTEAIFGWDRTLRAYEDVYRSIGAL